MPTREEQLNLPVVHVNRRLYAKYDPQIALDIVERIAEGELLIEITAAQARPLTVSRSTFLQWVETVPDLRHAYAVAIKLSAHAMEEKALIAAKLSADKPGSATQVSAVSLYVNQLRWSATRRDPQNFSDKGNTQVVVPVNIRTTLDLGTGTNKTEINDIYKVSLPMQSPTDVEFTEAPSEDVVRANGPSSAKAELRQLIRPEVPVKGLERQPLLQQARAANPPGNPNWKVGQPRKRVLTPRTPKNAAK